MPTSRAAENPRETFLGRLWRRFALRRQAQQDYRRARGTIHRQMLAAAQERLTTQLDLATQVYRNAKLAYEQRVRDRDEELTGVLVRHLVETQLAAVPGIGETFKSRILQYVFRSRLTDLHRAWRLEGIGEQRQREIDKWVSRIHQQLPRLLQQDFPGKSRIVASHGEKLNESRHRVDATWQWVSTLRELEGQIGEALAELEAVTWRDFYQALLTPTAPSEKVQQYIRGVFAPWEPVPDWFQSALSLKES